MQGLREFLKEYMWKNKIGTKGLSEKLGISRTMAWAAVSGKKKIGTQTVRVIAKYFKIDIKEVMFMVALDDLLDEIESLKEEEQ